MKVDPEIYRVTLAWMFYSVPLSEKTPKPFCELRVFFFTKERPLYDELLIAKEGMRVILEKLLIIFDTLPIAVGMNRADWDEDISLRDIRAKMRAEIEGFEVEEIDWDEVYKYFKSTYDRNYKGALKFLKNYRYARFYRKDGSIKAEYNEWDIRFHEKRLGIERVREVGEFITKTFGEIMEYVRRLEASRMEYEKLIEELRKITL